MFWKSVNMSPKKPGVYSEPRRLWTIECFICSAVKRTGGMTFISVISDRIRIIAQREDDSKTAKQCSIKYIF